MFKIKIEISVAEYSFRNGVNWSTIYLTDIPLEFIMKIADVNDKYKIFLDTSDAAVVKSAF